MKVKEIIKYGLVCDGKFIPFRTKSLAVKTGKLIYQRDNTVKLLKKVERWDIGFSCSHIKEPNCTEFDLTNLIKYK